MGLSLMIKSGVLSRDNSYRPKVSADASKTKFDPQLGFNTDELFSGGITVAKKINPRINAHLTPEIFMFKGDKKVRTSFGLAGGIGVGIL